MPVRKRQLPAPETDAEEAVPGGRKPRNLIDLINAVAQSGLSAPARSVVIELARHDARQWEEKWCSDLEAHTGIPARSLVRAKKEAIDAGWLSRTSSGKGGRGRVDRFAILIPFKGCQGGTVSEPKGVHPGRVSSAERVPDETVKGARLSAKGCQTEGVNPARVAQVNEAERKRSESKASRAKIPSPTPSADAPGSGPGKPEGMSTREKTYRRLGEFLAEKTRGEYEPDYEEGSSYRLRASHTRRLARDAGMSAEDFWSAVKAAWDDHSPGGMSAAGDFWDVLDQKIIEFGGE